LACKIVLVDDSGVDLEWFTIVARSAGYEVYTFEHALGLVMFIKEHQPDVVLLDVNMPALNGDVVCRILKDNQLTRHCRILLYSAMEETSLIRLVHQCGADGHIVKTKDQNELLRILAKYCQQWGFDVRPGPANAIPTTQSKTIGK
jgi:CheY-like chemotaxis protein